VLIWSHAGSMMPYLVERFNLMAKTPQFASKFPDGFTAAAAKFYYDTAQTSNPVAMSALRKVVPVTQIVKCWGIARHRQLPCHGHFRERTTLPLRQSLIGAATRL
jgi:hypothetical protein